MSKRRCLLSLVFLVASVLSPLLAHGSGVVFQTGDVLAGIGAGQIKHFQSDGTLLDTLTTGGSSYDTGMAFDAAGNLYATAFDAQNVYKFDNQGNLVSQFGSGYNGQPESIVFDKSGNAYVGQPDGSRQILKFDSLGNPLAAFSPATEDRGTDWIDLAADQCTMLYTSEGHLIKRFDVCKQMQLADFNVAPLPGSSAYALRIRPNGEVLVADTQFVVRLDSSGNQLHQYAIAGTGNLFALNLDPDDKTFWTGDLGNGAVSRVDIATGMLITQFNSAPVNALAGLTVVGEIVVAVTPPSYTTSYYVNEGSDSNSLKRAGSDLAKTQTAIGIAQDNVVALLFRAPTFKNGVYGVSGLGTDPPTPLTGSASVAELVEAFATGYYNCFGTADCPGTSQANQNMHVRVAIATGNGTTTCGGNQVTFGHGQAWAEMVNEVASWVISRKYAGRVDIAGGSDMEASAAVWPANNKWAKKCGSVGARQWAGPADTSQWVDGYASVAQRFLYDVGDAGGCPQSGTTIDPGSCNGGWTQDDVWFVSWGADPSEPLPEIYVTDQAPCPPCPRAQAKQWAQLSLYGYIAHSSSLIISGSLTQHEACQQPGRICNATDNTPPQGWQQLYDELKKDAHTKQGIPWSTDIKWMH